MESINKGDKVYFKGKYGMYYEVAVKSVAEQHAIVKGSSMFGTKKVRLDKLFKQPPKEFQQFSIEVNKLINKAEEELRIVKNSHSNFK